MVALPCAGRLDGGLSPPDGSGQFFGWRGVTYMENVQKRLNRLNCRLEWLSGVGPRNLVLDERAHWRHVANTVERLRSAVMCGSATQGSATPPVAKLLLTMLSLLLLFVLFICIRATVEVSM